MATFHTQSIFNFYFFFLFKNDLLNVTLQIEELIRFSNIIENANRSIKLGLAAEP